MPLLKIFTSAEPLPTAHRSELLKAASALLARELGKPEAYVMTCIVPQTAMTFAGSEAPSAYAELKNIGIFSPELTERLSRALCALLSNALGVPQNRIYIEFTDAEAHRWGFDGGTFA
ncbi:MAG TPA: phenylpyruvate tautomerase MIF-related protein [Polyangiaceae bacterium]|jgi:phenylpyruvate tautomerase PptA (4-oxalocrotonate tautomerase family)|nr:phenylpyruvate tautomerase MIF-related protein [Polyangiaceae bacterium]